MSERWLRGLGALALGLVCACGSGDADGPEQRSMVPSARTAEDGENRAPVVSELRLEPARPQPGESVEARAEASDPDGDKLRLSYRWKLNGRELSISGPVLPGGSVSRDDRIELTVVATDGNLDSEQASVRAAVEPRAPTLVSVSFDAPEKLKPGDEISALVDASAGNDAALRLEYRWLVNGRELRERERTLSTAGLKRGDRIQVKVRAQDGDTLSETMTSKELVLGNSPPEIAGIPKAEREGDAFRYRFEARDPDGDRSLRWSLGEAPPGMSIDPIYGVATWRPGKEQAGTHTIEVQVSDKHGDGSSLRFQVTATVSEKTAAGAAEPAAPPAPAAPARDDS